MTRCFEHTNLITELDGTGFFDTPSWPPVSDWYKRSPWRMNGSNVATVLGPRKTWRSNSARLCKAKAYFYCWGGVRFSVIGNENCTQSWSRIRNKCLGVVGVFMSSHCRKLTIGSSCFRHAMHHQLAGSGTAGARTRDQVLEEHFHCWDMGHPCTTAMHHGVQSPKDATVMPGAIQDVSFAIGDREVDDCVLRILIRQASGNDGSQEVWPAKQGAAKQRTTHVQSERPKKFEGRGLGKLGTWDYMFRVFSKKSIIH